MIPAGEAGAGRFDAATLAAIDAGLAVSPDDRPSDIATWRVMLAGDGTPIPAPPPTAPAGGDVLDDAVAEADRQTALAGDAEAQYRLGGLYYWGRGVPKDVEEALRWRRMAADQGHANAQYFVGLVLENGEAGTADPVAARSWFEVAAAQGHVLSQSKLRLAEEGEEETVVPVGEDPGPVDVEPTPSITPPPQPPPRPICWGRGLLIIIVLGFAMALIAPWLSQSPQWVATLKETVTSSFGSPAVNEERIFVALKAARVRAQATVDSAQVGSVPVGDTVTVVDRTTGGPVTAADRAAGSADWYSVARTDGGEGFVYAPLLGRQFRDCGHCPEMVVIDDGTFIMGSDDHPSEEPAHLVDMVRVFSIGKYEVTIAEWKACVDDGECSAYPLSGTADENPRRPITSVSWPDAVAYVNWLAATTGRDYRLPSEGEWEYAARAGSTATWPWGDRAQDACAYANVWDQYGRAGVSGNDDQIPHDCSDGWTLTAPVGSYWANGFGLHDMTGNASEWTADCWYDSHAGAPGDGSPRGGDCALRVFRGGSWADGTETSRSASRQAGYEEAPDDAHGLRVLRDLVAR